ncbi:adenylate kinase family protein [Trichococcus ilyis]|uniref:Adenylate kinase n=1 Tax=Trichococcus ilyis TaxID=640938 RepID=A0A143Z4L8_9LACT|nr:nucleoside monophosphate kinase [Trichococcus ilyis]CZR07210.1 adenylate kinase/ump-cmp kinase [Trichococcus ilyis]SEJ93293.1 Adenylate kinase [Trichococcus ilyis]
MNIIIIGMPGAGLGTQAREIAAAYHIPYISTGEIFRSYAEIGSPIGLEVKTFMDMGKLVPDRLVNKLLWDRMGDDDIKAGFILEGYPRTRQQAEALDAYLESKRLSLDAVLYLAVGKEVLRKRLEQRSDSPRLEDKSEVIERRLQVSAVEMEALMSFYQEAGIVSMVNGEQEPDIVFGKIQEVLQFHS